MANKDSVVDISSNRQVLKLYNKKGKMRRIICLILSIIFLIGGSGLMYYYAVLNSMNFKDISNPGSGTKTQQSGATTPTSDNLTGNGTQLMVGQGQLLQDPKVLNVMLFGEDNKGEDEHGRTDSMIMLSIDSRHKKIKITSFQRDSYVYIPGHGQNKLNAAYSIDGPKLTIETIETNFGVKVDRYAVVDYDSFIKIIDTLDGIDMEVTEDEIEYINYQMYKNEETTDRYTIKSAPGIVHLNGQEALWYARNRGLSIGEDGNEIGLDGNDWERTSRQRKMLETMFNRFKNADLGQIISIVSSIGPMITTNLKKEEITTLLPNAPTYLKYDVEQYYVPSDNWQYNDNVIINGERSSVIQILNLDTARLAFAQFLYEDSLTTGGGATLPASTQKQTQTQRQQ
ncbi:MAG: LCP family protein [Ruminococcus sp.]|nr:LCP family protein [Ruminococcus sp.]